MFIVFDGPDGAGKTGILDSVVRKLRENTDYNIVTSFEPGGTDTGQEIRKTLLSGKTIPAPMTELMLYIADRADHYEKVLKPNLEKENTIIISDRYWESSIVYQILERKVMDLKSFYEIHKLITNNLKPEMMFLITSDKPHKLKGDRLDSEGNGFRDRIVNYYDKLDELELIDYEIIRIQTNQKEWEQYQKQIIEHIYRIL